MLALLGSFLKTSCASEAGWSHFTRDLTRDLTPHPSISHTSLSTEVTLKRPTPHWMRTTKWHGIWSSLGLVIHGCASRKEHSSSIGVPVDIKYDTTEHLINFVSESHKTVVFAHRGVFIFQRGKNVG